MRRYFFNANRSIANIKIVFNITSIEIICVCFYKETIGARPLILMENKSGYGALSSSFSNCRYLSSIKLFVCAYCECIGSYLPFYF